MKRAVIAALEAGLILHEMRMAFDAKNLLGHGGVTVEELVKIIKASQGTEYTCSPLHGNPDIDCHLLKTSGWYVKFYFTDPCTVFISVHRMQLS